MKDIKVDAYTPVDCWDFIRAIRDEQAIKAARRDSPEDWMDEAREVAAQCWCDPETSDRVMDPELAEAVAKRLAVWMDTAAQSLRNSKFYRGLVERCGKAIGADAYTQDDGGVCKDVLCHKVPELVEDLVRRAGAESVS